MGWQGNHFPRELSHAQVRGAGAANNVRSAGNYRTAVGECACFGVYVTSKGMLGYMICEGA